MLKLVEHLHLWSNRVGQHERLSLVTWLNGPAPKVIVELVGVPDLLVGRAHEEFFGEVLSVQGLHRTARDENGDEQADS